MGETWATEDMAPSSLSTDGTATLPRLGCSVTVSPRALAAFTRMVKDPEEPNQVWKGEQAWAAHTPNSPVCSKATVASAARCWGDHTPRPRGGQSPEMDQHVHGQLCFDKGALPSLIFSPDSARTTEHTPEKGELETLVAHEN